MKLFAGVCISSVAAHSWIACVDYAEKNAEYYDHSKCRGWPRAASRYVPIGGVFGGDSGFDTRPQGNTSPCASTRSADDYENGHHSAVYFPGQQVIMAHPMKNHGASTECTNKYIPDHGNWIYYQEQTQIGQEDPKLFKFKEKELVNLGISPFGHQQPDNVVNSYPKPGFQNAPKFCEDTDKSLGTYSFNIPRDINPGKYTFAWLWAFNGQQDYYSTCFDVEVVSDAASRQQKLSARGQNDFSLPCDSSPTSAGDAGSMVGCDTSGNTGGSDNNDSGENGQNEDNETNDNTGTENDDQTDPATMGTVSVNQMTGKIYLPRTQNQPSKREIHVVFYSDCANVARPNFWYARLDFKTNNNGDVLHRFRRSDGGQSHAIHYVIQQDQEEDIKRGYVGFHWAFEGGCNILRAPAAVHVDDTF